jgi:DNA topoisomerase VI subunit A
MIKKGKGEPDIATRYLVNKLYKVLKIKFFCLTDANPYGI